MTAALLLATAVMLGAAEDEGAWTTLFNGKDLTGWTVKARPEDKAKNFWKVDDGAILADSMGAGKHDYVWLYSEKEYGDFVLRLRFQAYKDSPGNSGIQLRSRYDDAAYWLDGPQIDIQPPEPWRTGMMWDETRGARRWIYPNLPDGKWVDSSMAPKDHKFIFAGDGDGWNEMEIRAQGNKIEASLNGVKVANLDGAGILDDAIHKQRNVGRKGHIAIQIHANDQLKIRFKDIQIRERVWVGIPNI
jgi:hypothetical protein